MAEAEASVKNVPLSNGIAIPQLGFGTFRLRGDECVQGVAHALKTGYRHIDTAMVYRNHEQVKQGIKLSGVARKDIFLTSKLSPAYQGEEKAYNACLAVLEELGVSYLDLFIIHWPGTQGTIASDTKQPENRQGSWRALQRLYKEGKCRAIGVSNYTTSHLETLLSDPTTTIKPQVNQVEIHPLYPQHELREYCRKSGIVVEAYSSLGTGEPLLLKHPTVSKVAASNGISEADVCLQWAVANGLIVLPKSKSFARIEHNFKVATNGVSLAPEELEQLNKIVEKQEALHEWATKCEKEFGGSSPPVTREGVKFCWDPISIP